MFMKNYFLYIIITINYYPAKTVCSATFSVFVEEVKISYVFLS